MNNEKTFVILTPGFPSSETDTTCLPMQQYVVRVMREMYPDIKIIVLSFQYPYHKNTYDWFDVRVIPFSGKNKGGLPKLLVRKKIFTVLQEIYSKNKIIGLFSFWYNECAWIAKKFGDRHRIRHACWILGQDARKENKYPESLKPTASELLALSEFIQDEFEKNHGVRPRFVIPPAIDPREFDDNPPEKDVDILAVGSLISLKRYDLFLEVVAEIRKQLPNVKAMLIGDGLERMRLESMIEKLELRNNIIMTGELPHASVLKWMQRARIFLHPSSYEGFGVVCLEALYAAAHVISFCRPMKKEIVQWHIAKNKEEMISMALEILQGQKKDHLSAAPFLMKDTVKAIGQIFNFH